MDAVAIFDLVLKGLSVVQSLIEAEQQAEPAIKALIALITGAQKGTITPEELDKTESLLDSLIDDFNLELPMA